MNLNNYKTVFFIGIGGMGMRALAAILLDKGFAVKGSDKNNSDWSKQRGSGSRCSIDRMYLHLF